MKTIGIALVALAAITSSASAQVTGAVNRTAPKIEQSINLGANGVIKLNYTAITYASGNWAATLADESKRERMKTSINGKADSSPMAAFSSTKDVMINGTRIAAGDYEMAFVLNDEYNWELRLKSGDKATHIAMDLMDSPEPSKRLICSLHGGDEDGTAGVYIAFGSQIAMLEIDGAPAADEDGTR